jgi:membrane-associated phospholipid phosphatase
VTGKTLSGTAAIALLLSAIAVAVCYHWVDQPVARFVAAHRLVRHDSLAWLAVASARLKVAAIPAILAVVGWWCWKPGGRAQTVLLAISVNLIVTSILKQSLKWGFGRYWPETWTEGNPSLIAGGDYGFHPFHYGTRYESFPSGHAAVIFSVIAILWLSYPRWRWLYVSIAAAVAVALVALNFHFVGDVIAGATLGAVAGLCVAHGFRLDDRGPGEQPSDRRSADEWGGSNAAGPTGAAGPPNRDRKLIADR